MDITLAIEIGAGVASAIVVGSLINKPFHDFVFGWAHKVDVATSSDSDRMQREINRWTRTFEQAQTQFDNLKGDFAHENNVLFSLQHKLEEAEAAYKRAASAPDQYTKEAIESRFQDVQTAQHAVETQQKTVDGMKGPLEQEQRTMKAAKTQLETLARDVTDVKQKEQLTKFNTSAASVLAGAATAMNPSSSFSEAKDNADRQLERSKEALKTAQGGDGKLAADEADAAAADAEARRKLNEKLGIPTAAPAAPTGDGAPAKA